METTPSRTFAVHRPHAPTGRLRPVSFSLFALPASLLCLFLLSACKPGRHIQIAPEPPTVETITLAAADIPITHEWVATLDGSTNAVIRPQVAGYILRQVYADGSVVRKGDLLFEIDDRPFKAALEQSSASLAQAQAQVGKTELDVKRYTPLAATDAISKQELDDAVQADLSAKAQVAAAKAQVEKSGIDLAFTKIHAPIDGLAGQSKVQIGDLVNALSLELTTISTIDPIRAYFSPSEQEYLRYRQHHQAAANATGASAEMSDHSQTRRPNSNDQNPNEQRRGSAPIENQKSKIENSATLTLILSDGSRYPHAGRFEFIDRHVDATTGSIRLVALFPNPDNQLRPGMFARLRAVTDIRRAAIAIPQRAVIEMQGTYQVLVYSPDAGTASVRPIKVGERLPGSRWVVLEGLKPGDQVIVEGLQKARPGVPLRAKPYGEKAEALKD